MVHYGRQTFVCPQAARIVLLIWKRRKRKMLNCERTKECAQNGPGRMVMVRDQERNSKKKKEKRSEETYSIPAGPSFGLNKQCSFRFISNYAAWRCVCGKTLNAFRLLLRTPYTRIPLISWKPAFRFRRLFFIVISYGCASLHLCMATHHENSLLSKRNSGAAAYVRFHSIAANALCSIGGSDGVVSCIVTEM